MCAGLPLHFAVAHQLSVNWTVSAACRTKSGCGPAAERAQSTFESLDSPKAGHYAAESRCRCSRPRAIRWKRDCPKTDAPAR